MVRKLLLAALLLVSCAHGVHVEPNQHGLAVVSDAATYRRLVAADPQNELVDLAEFAPEIALDVRYATTNNFMKRELYPEARVFLRRPAAAALRRVQAALAADGVGLKVFDAYRPYSVTEAMWEAVGDPDYVADPARGSRHNRGAAVDLTLIDLASGEELPMPTGYDSFEPAAHHGYQELPPEAIRNRERLREVMIRNGFEPLSTEWWHYDFAGWDRFHLMNLPFTALD